jgi:hypothetical protein
MVVEEVVAALVHSRDYLVVRLGMDFLSYCPKDSEAAIYSLFFVPVFLVVEPEVAPLVGESGSVGERSASVVVMVSWVVLGLAQKFVGAKVYSPVVVRVQVVE